MTTSNTRDDLGRAIESAFHQLELEEVDLFSASEYQRFMHAGLRRKRTRWLQQHPCMYPGCSSRSIARSHVIPKSGPLKRIAEAGHVITPRFDHSRVRLSVDRVGLGEASTFPGFCENHESVFSAFERSGDLVTEGDFALQCFRVVCREIRLKEEQRHHLASLLNEYENSIRTKVLDRVQSVLGRSLENSDLQNLRVTTDLLQHLTEQTLTHIKTLDEEIEEYKSEFLVHLSSTPIDPNGNLAGTAVTVPYPLPVCLAGRGNFQLGKTSVVALLLVWPRSDHETILFLLSPSRNKEAIDTYLQAFSSPPFRMLSMVESWMIHGSDHWFLKPSVWTQLPKVRQERILADITDTSKNIGYEYVGSVFDEIRLAWIERVRSQLIAGEDLPGYALQELNKVNLQTPEHHTVLITKPEDLDRLKPSVR